LQESARRCILSALCFGLGLLVLACLVLLALLAFFLVLEVLVLEVLVRPRGRSVGITSVALAGRRVLNGLSGLSFCGRVETNFDPLVFRGCEESVDAVDAPVGNLYVEEARVHEALNDSLLSRKGVLALGAANIGKLRLDGLRDSLVCPNGCVVDIACVRSFRSGSGCRTNRCNSYFERRVCGRTTNVIAR
jgi:hypothetical protein